MMTEIPLSWSAGIDNVSPEAGLPAGTVHDAVNCDFDMAAGVMRRPGRTLGLTQANMSSLWTSQSGESYCVVDGFLCSVTCDGSTVTVSGLLSLADDLPTSFDDLLDGVVFSNTAQIGVIQDGVARSIGVENPGQPVVGNDPVGNLAAGRYGVAVSFVVGYEESGLSPMTLAELSDGQGLRIDVPQPEESSVTYINLYRTEANAEVLRLAATIPVGISSYLLGAGQVGRIADNQFQERILPGSIVRYWRGRIIVASGSNLLFSQAMRYGRFDRRTDFIQFPKAVTLLEPVTHGVWVGTEDGPVFLAGDQPSEFTHRKTGGQAPIPYSGTRIQASDLGGDLGGNEETYALWLARNGYVLGSPDGKLIEMHRNRLSLPSAQWTGTAHTFVHNRRVLTTLN